MSSSSNLPLQSRPCIDCWANLPLSAYGVNIASKDGHVTICKACRAEWSSLNWTKKYGRKHKKYDPEIIRGAMRHNQILINHMFAMQNVSLIGYIPHTDKVFRVLFGNDQRGIPSFAIINVDGSSFKDFTYSDQDIDMAKGHVYDILKRNRIRLELTDADMIASKTVIYYL